MRLHRLEVEGFGPFRSRQVVDFDAFADDGIFLIGGRTGAGKSSILDAVCFGLYGGVPRYDGGEKRLRSDHCEPDDPTSVAVEFSTVAGRFRVTRSPSYERPAKRGGGMTTQAPSASLEELTDAGWVGRAARVVDVANELADILQLSQEQFLQVILLAQNRFADFLLADSRERQKLLRRLFGTERFEDYQQRFDERRRLAEQSLAARRATIEARLEEAERIATDAELWGDSGPAAGGATTEERLETLQRALARAEYRAERLAAERADAEKRLEAADAALTELTRQREAQTERDRARAALAALDAQADEIAADRRRRDLGRAAEALRGVIAAARRAQAALADAERGESEARDALPAAVAAACRQTETDGDLPPAAEGSGDVTRLRAFASDLTRESGAWQRAAELEQRSADRERELAEAEQEAAAAGERITALQAERAELPGRIAELTAERDAARRAGDRAEDLARAVEDARTCRAAAAEVARLDDEIAAAERRLAELTTAHAEAQTALARLRQRRLDGFAGELATALVPGEPCAVCGATEHPSPAEHADPVSAEDIADAEARRDDAARAERQAESRLGERRAERAAAAERSRGLSPSAAEAVLETASAAHAEAEAAAERALALDAALARCTAQAEDVERRQTEAAQEQAAARERLALLRQTAEDAQRAIAAARGAHATVADRLAEAGAHIHAATRAADAIEDRLVRETAAADADADLAAALETSPFGDTAEVEAALLPAAEIARLDDRITQHAVQREKERGILLELELLTLPEEPIDLAPATAAAAEARAAWIAAVEAAGRIDGVNAALAAAIDGAASEHRVSAADTADYETIRGLADAVAGRSGNTHRMNLETFVLAAELEEIVDAANLRLREMSSGRYRLQHSDALAARGAASGLGIVVHDAYTGQTRPARSLSGGETFLSSLALALGLAEVVTARAGGIRLDTLFIDEGFGSLDADTLEIAMRTLDELRQGGRTVGVISHVEAMQEQIPAQLTVRTLPDGPSVVEAAFRTS
ncbi:MULTISPECIES: AAA family ATPase [Microbacterium]|uniref:AAA family ATPase n=1 Tax=Microbacterium TaxID=33882 RepID=UPI00217CC870|nr:MULTISPECIES: SMC family ATPase [Microbacterium]UWF77807.1 SMC family ATPase [Microbacterium neungamense]WCM55983.1 SMC family ATPase [Microbacterium sp. EF45047]